MTPQEQKEKIIEILEGIRGKWFQARFEKRLEWEKDRNKLADQILQALQPEKDPEEELEEIVLPPIIEGKVGWNTHIILADKLNQLVRAIKRLQKLCPKKPKTE